MSGHVLITIGITCFNAEATIARAVDSALAQTWPNTEIIVTDDCSSDTSAAILRSYQSAHSNVRILTNKINCGVSHNRQVLLTEAKGQYLAFFDDDDRSFPDRLEKQISRLRLYAAQVGHENIFCYGDRVLIKATQREKVLLGIGRAPQEPHGLMVADMILANKRPAGYSWGLLGSGTMLCPVHLLRKAGGFDASFRRSAELDLAIRASRFDAHFISVDSPVIEQYFHHAPHKAAWRVGKYHFKLIAKHWRLVIGRRLFFKVTYPYTRFLKRKMGFQVP